MERERERERVREREKERMEKKGSKIVPESERDTC